MKQNQSGSTAVLAVFILLVLGALAAAGFFLYQQGILGSSVPAAETVQPDVIAPQDTRIPEDINVDGAVTGVDQQLVNASVGCAIGDLCWNEVIGKTLEGDNPIYASDLDLNGDGAITDEDVAMVTAQM